MKIRSTFFDYMLRDQAGDGGSGGSDGGKDGGDKGGSESLLDGAKSTLQGGAGAGEGEDKSGGTEGQSGDGEAYKPDGIAENLIGKTDRETIDLMAKSVKGFLAKNSEAGRSGTVPDKPDGYAFEASGDDDTEHELLQNEALQPVIGHARAAAHAAEIPTEQFEKFMRHYASNGLNPADFMSDEDAIKVSAAAEREALDAMTGDPAVSQGIMDFVLGKAEHFQSAGVMTAEDMAEYRVMVGTAEGMAVMHKIIGGLTGEKSVPIGAGEQGGAMSKASAQASMSEALAMKPGPAREQAIKEADAQIVKAFGTAPAGSSVVVG